MKHIRKYESTKVNDSYEKISSDNPDTVNFKRQENFTKDEIHYIREYFKKKNPQIIFLIKSLFGFDYMEFKTRNNKVNLSICDLGDEWYLVADNKGLQFYKCDQLDGLTDCLDTIL